MCGIAGYWNREASFDPTVMTKFIARAADRGNDGHGVVAITEVGEAWTTDSMLSLESLGTVRSKKTVGSFLEEVTKLREPGKHQFVLANCRAHPSTEVASSLTNMQPIVYSKDGVYLVHNGAVSDSHRKEFRDYHTDIDSEMIIKAYLRFDRNLKRVVEHLVGGFAFILLDTQLRQLNVVTDYKPLSIGYLRPNGFFVHSMEEAGRELIQDVTGCTHDGQCVWENYYSHPQASYVIRQIDIDSGMEHETPFTPRFLAPGFDTADPGIGEKCYVLASGGIDSGMTACILKKLGYDVTMVYYDYGHKGAESEHFCAEHLAESLGCDFLSFNLGELFSHGDSNSSLISDKVDILTGTEDGLKSTQAWVPFRNAYFLSHLVTIIEQEIMEKNLAKVYICGGYASLEEEGFYPDNSERFISSFFDMVSYGALTGKRMAFINVLQNIMKYEEWVLGDKLGFPFEHTCSCDQPKMAKNPATGERYVELCKQCGSTLMSIWAAEQAGVRDPRAFYDKKVDFELRKKRVSGIVSGIDVDGIVARLKLPAGTVDVMKLRAVIDREIR